MAATMEREASSTVSTSSDESDTEELQRLKEAAVTSDCLPSAPTSQCTEKLPSNRPVDRNEFDDNYQSVGTPEFRAFLAKKLEEKLDREIVYCDTQVPRSEIPDWLDIGKKEPDVYLFDDSPYPIPFDADLDAYVETPPQPQRRPRRRVSTSSTDSSEDERLASAAVTVEFLEKERAMFACLRPNPPTDSASLKTEETASPATDIVKKKKKKKKKNKQVQESSSTSGKTETNSRDKQKNDTSIDSVSREVTWKANVSDVPLENGAVGCRSRKTKGKYQSTDAVNGDHLEEKPETAENDRSGDKKKQKKKRKRKKKKGNTDILTYDSKGEDDKSSTGFEMSKQKKKKHLNFVDAPANSLNNAQMKSEKIKEKAKSVGTRETTTNDSGAVVKKKKRKYSDSTDASLSSLKDGSKKSEKRKRKKSVEKRPDLGIDVDDAHDKNTVEKKRVDLTVTFSNRLNENHKNTSVKKKRKRHANTTDISLNDFDVEENGFMTAKKKKKKHMDLQGTLTNGLSGKMKFSSAKRKS